jgi:hypothetical protein
MKYGLQLGKFAQQNFTEIEFNHLMKGADFYKKWAVDGNENAPMLLGFRSLNRSIYRAICNRFQTISFNFFRCSIENEFNCDRLLTRCYLESFYR